MKLTLCNLISKYDLRFRAGNKRFRAGHCDLAKFRIQKSYKEGKTKSPVCNPYGQGELLYMNHAIKDEAGGVGKLVACGTDSLHPIT